MKCWSENINSCSKLYLLDFEYSGTPGEAANQEFVYKLSGTCNLKVPKIYRYFRISNVGYIVMESIHGTSLQKIPSQEYLGLIHRLEQATHSLFQQIPVDLTGPRNGGILCTDGSFCLLD